MAVRAPEDNLECAHFLERGIVGQVEHPELGRSFGYPTAPRAQTDLPWRKGRVHLCWASITRRFSASWS